MSFLEILLLAAIVCATVGPLAWIINRALRQ